MGKRYFPSNPKFAIAVWFMVLGAILANVEPLVGKHARVKSEFVSLNTTPLTPPTALRHYELTPENKELRCLSENIYYEASTQSYAGKLAVGEVVMNRLKSHRYASTICGVISERSNDVCQFSWFCKPRKSINKNSASWKDSQKVATQLLAKGGVIDITQGAIAYHATYVNPSWSKHLRLVTQIDQQIFYR